jgi:FkbM family methyltransferase
MPSKKDSAYLSDRVEVAASCRDCDMLRKVEKAGQTFGANDEFQLMHNGLIVCRGAYHGEWMTEIIRRLRGHHEPQEEKVFAEALRYLPDSAVMLELGSFWAYYSMWAHQQIKHPSCIMVEPNAHKLAVGKEHFLLNRMNGIFIRGFVGSHSEPLASFKDWDGAIYKIPMLSIDGMMEERKLPKIDILHADVQGAEFDMLKGAARALREQRIGYIFVSTHGCWHERCLKHLADHGYLIIASHSVLESFSGDGLIVARAPNYPGPDRVKVSVRRVSVLERFRYRLACMRQRLF